VAGGGRRESRQYAALRRPGHASRGSNMRGNFESILLAVSHSHTPLPSSSGKLPYCITQAPHPHNTLHSTPPHPPPQQLSPPSISSCQELGIKIDLACSYFSSPPRLLIAVTRGEHWLPSRFPENPKSIGRAAAGVFCRSSRDRKRIPRRTGSGGVMECRSY